MLIGIAVAIALVVIGVALVMVGADRLFDHVDVPKRDETAPAEEDR